MISAFLISFAKQIPQKLQEVAEQLIMYFCRINRVIRSYYYK
ncbi:hypothetical protein SAMN05216462_1453 [Xylanibacter ruminicola]|uniref:Uncharacterized protein n=1 Tax=Xylanibacter ruminicola TaxID=839 RepID=A0A1H4B081_XYLRU|nr:hypothetical protein SAMN05216462_1453 [Xylanibacter ruminicola]